MKDLINTINNNNTNSFNLSKMKTKYQISGLMFICLIISAIALVFVACDSPSEKKAILEAQYRVDSASVVRPIQISPLFAGTVEYADSLCSAPRTIIIYAYAADKYDAERIMCEEMLKTDTCHYNISINPVEAYNKPFKLQR